MTEAERAGSSWPCDAKSLGIRVQHLETLFDKWRCEMEEKLVALQRRLAAEMRLELRSDSCRDSAMVSALEKHVFLLEQRLDGHIEEIAEECAKSKNTGSMMLRVPTSASTLLVSTTLSDTDEPTSPRTRGCGARGGDDVLVGRIRGDGRGRPGAGHFADRLDALLRNCLISSPTLSPQTQQTGTSTVGCQETSKAPLGNPSVTLPTSNCAEGDSAHADLAMSSSQDATCLMDSPRSSAAAPRASPAGRTPPFRPLAASLSGAGKDEGTSRSEFTSTRQRRNPFERGNALRTAQRTSLSCGASRANRVSGGSCLF